MSESQLLALMAAVLASQKNQVVIKPADAREHVQNARTLLHYAMFDDKGRRWPALGSAPTMDEIARPLEEHSFLGGES